jgi:hypothetical protein
VICIASNINGYLTPQWQALEKIAGGFCDFAARIQPRRSLSLIVPVKHDMSQIQIMECARDVK